MGKDLKNVVLAAMGGDGNAFGTLYEAYSVDMYRFALSICKNTHDAQDAVQETALSVFRSISSIKNPEKFKSYLFLSLSNTCKHKMAGRTEQTEFVDTGYIDSEIEFSIPVHEALEKLDDISREILMLSVVAGFKSREVGEMMKMPANTVRTKRKRALKKMREELEL